jgi:hypothetical protein
LNRAGVLEHARIAMPRADGGERLERQREARA